MKVLTTTVARWAFGLPFGIFGLFHFMNAEAMAGMVPIPGGAFWVYLTGLAFWAACISILSGRYTRLGCLLLALMLFIFVLSIHVPSAIGGDQQALAKTFNDIALAGGALILAGISEEEAPQESPPAPTGEMG